MTPEKIERNFEACGLKLAKEATKLIIALCEYSASEERERCAKIVETYQEAFNNYREESPEKIAAAIRAEGDKA
jgi:ADP-heptose:LPS heptosyltransferase